MKVLLSLFFILTSGIQCLYAMEKDDYTIPITLSSGPEVQRLFHSASFPLDPEKIYNTRINNNSLLSLVDKYIELIQYNREACINEKDATLDLLTRAFLQAMAQKFRLWIKSAEFKHCSRDNNELSIDYIQNITMFESEYALICSKLPSRIRALLGAPGNEKYTVILATVLMKLFYSPAFQLFFFSAQVKEFLGSEFSLIMGAVKASILQGYRRLCSCLPMQDIQPLNNTVKHCRSLRLETEVLESFTLPRPDNELEKKPSHELSIGLQPSLDSSFEEVPYESLKQEDSELFKRKGHELPYEGELKRQRFDEEHEELPLVIQQSFKARELAFEISTMLSQYIEALDTIKLQNDLILYFDADKLTIIKNFLLVHQDDLDEKIAFFIAYDLCRYAKHETTPVLFDVFANNEASLSLCLDLINSFS